MGFIARDKNEVIGAILGHFVTFKGKKGFKLVELFVDINYQNRGIGTKLLTQLELNLKQNNYDFVLLLTAKNSTAESFYLNRNYRRDDKLVLLRKEI